MASVAIVTKADQLPAQLVEVANALQLAELAYNADPLNVQNPLFTAANNVSIDTNFEDKTVSVTATLPMVASHGANGEIVVTVSDYL